MEVTGLLTREGGGSSYLSESTSVGISIAAEVSIHEEASS